MKKIIMLFMIVGSYAGGYLPVLWGADVMSISSLFFGAIGGFLGIWAGYKLSARYGID
jgi:hypothetical protein